MISLKPLKNSSKASIVNWNNILPLFNKIFKVKLLADFVSLISKTEESTKAALELGQAIHLSYEITWII